MPLHLRELQIELSGICNATCSYCTWQQRSAGRTRMETPLAARLIREAAQARVDLVTYHGVGESTLHPDLFYLLSLGESLGLSQRLSTNCYLLDRWRSLESLRSLNVVLALHWGLKADFLKRCLDNAEAYLCGKPANHRVEVLLVCSEDQSAAAPLVLDRFLPLVERLPNAVIHFKQPQTWPDSPPIKGCIPEVSSHPRIELETQQTPRSLGRGCSMPEYLLQVMADGTSAPCCAATHDWKMPSLVDHSIEQVWNGPDLSVVRHHWSNKDDDVPCGHCLKRTDC